jgi:hypothetical protein
VGHSRLVGNGSSRFRAWLGLALLGFAAAAAPGYGQSVHAEAPPPAAPPERVEFDSVLVGALLDFGYGSAAVGDSLLGDLGAEYVGIRTFRDRAWLLQWDALLAARGGLLGNTRPYTGLAGMRTVADGEIGYRWLRARTLSPYTGARVDGELIVMTRPGTSLSDLDRLNNLDGVAGVSAHGALRIDAGLSLLDGARSLVVVGFFQEALRAPGVYTPGAAFAEGGVGARFDLRRRLTASLELSAGQSPTSTQAALGTSDQTTIVELSALVRFVLRSGVWLQAAGGYSREFDRRTYQSSPLTYQTASAPSFDVTLALGVSLDRRRWRAGAAQ